LVPTVWLSWTPIANSMLPSLLKLQVFVFLPYRSTFSLICFYPASSLKSYIGERPQFGFQQTSFLEISQEEILTEMNKIEFPLNSPSSMKSWTQAIVSSCPCPFLATFETKLVFFHFMSFFLSGSHHPLFALQQPDADILGTCTLLSAVLLIHEPATSLRTLPPLLWLLSQAFICWKFSCPITHKIRSRWRGYSRKGEHSTFPPRNLKDRIVILFGKTGKKKAIVAA
jgi:hypothetical protein